MTIAERQVGLPSAKLAANPDRARPILQVGIDQRQEAVGGQRSEIGVRRRGRGGDGGEVSVGGGVGRSVIGRAQSVALAVGSERIGFEIADRNAGIDEEVEIFGLGVAKLELQPVEGQLARIEARNAVGRHIVGSKIVARAIGRVAIAIFGGQVDVALAHRKPEVGADGGDRPVARLALPAFVGQQIARVGRVQTRLSGAIGHQAVEVGDPVQRGDIFAEAGDRSSAIVGAFEADVDHPGDGIGPILRRGAVAKHFDPLDRQRRDQIHVDRRAAATDRAVDIEQGRDVAPLAVDQHQGLVGAEPAQRCGPKYVGAIGDRRLREVERGHQRVEHLIDLGQPGVGQRIGADDVDRDRRIGNRAIGAPRPRDDDRILQVRIGILGRRRGRYRGCGRNGLLGPCG